MPTALDIITDALESIGVYAPGETVSSADSKHALGVLNDLQDSWSNDGLAVFANADVSHVLTPGTYQYTIGDGGDIDTARPLRIFDGYGSAYTTDVNSNRYPLEVITQDRWNLIGNVVTVNSSEPTHLFYNPQYPLATINLFPVPTLASTLRFLAELQLTSFAALATSMSLPPGYSRALKRNLALDLWPYYKGVDKEPPRRLVTSAERALAAIKRTNTKANVAIYDTALQAGVGRTANIYRGTSGWT